MIQRVIYCGKWCYIDLASSILKPDPQITFFLILIPIKTTQNK